MKMYEYLAILILNVHILGIAVYAETSVPRVPSDVAACPKDLSHLQDAMESLLRRVDVPEFIRTMRESLQASLPEVIGTLDGLQPEIESLREEIRHQERVEKSAEFIARKVSNNPVGPLEPCRRREEGGYCSTVERYYMARAANLANREFLRALQCYQEAGIR